MPPTTQPRLPESADSLDEDALREAHARIQAQQDLRRRDRLRRLPAELGYADAEQLIAALRDVFGIKTAVAAAAPAAEAPPTLKRSAARGVGVLASVEAERTAGPVRRAQTVPAEWRVAPPDTAALVRNTLARRLCATHILDPEVRRREVEERDVLTRAILLLHTVGVDRTPAAMRQPLRDVEIERAATVFRRLALIGRRKPDEIAAVVEKAARRDTDPLAHLADPFQLRHLLCFHTEIPHEELTALQIYELERAWDAEDETALRVWFDGLHARKAVLPRDTTHFLRSLLLRRIQSGKPCLETVVFEQAVLDVRFFGAIGWENTRAFYSLLKRMTGAAGCVFDGYIDGDDLDEAIDFHQSCDDVEHLAHFCTLRRRHRAETVAETEQAVIAAARDRDAGRTPRRAGGPPPAGPNEGRRRTWGTLRGWQSAPGAA